MTTAAPASDQASIHCVNIINPEAIGRINNGAPR
jgi:hypothetical protein